VTFTFCSVTATSPQRQQGDGRTLLALRAGEQRESNMPTSKPTRRAALAALGGLPVVTSMSGAQPPPGQPFAPHENKIPIRGKAGPGLEAFDDAMVSILEHHGLPGAALSITKHGRLVLAKGYGWADTASGKEVEPDTLFNLASLSKSITAVAVLKLVEQGKLKLDDKVFDLLPNVKPPRGAKVDDRLKKVTVRQCLNHSGGWDRTKNGDPVNWEPQICRAMRVAPPLSPVQFLSFMLSVPLDFAPGASAVYSNVGFVILGEVVAAASKQSYEKFVQDNVLKPMGITAARLNPRDGKYAAGSAHRYLAGTLLGLPALRFPMIDATGGWLASVVDMAKFLANLDGTRGKPVLNEESRKLMREAPPAPLKPRENGTFFGLGWDAVIVQGKDYGYFKDGCYQGMRTYMKRLPNGVNWALVFNASMEFDPTDMQLAGSAIQEVRKHVEYLEKHPEIDLFKDFA
jgi:N-acyl-D-amino-acid deacylase